MKLIERILRPENLNQACKEVVKNKGSGGVDRMSVKELTTYLSSNREQLTNSILQGKYLPQPIRGKEIPKSGGRKRLLGIPTAVDRMLQQAVLRAVMPLFEYEFSDHSYGFRPKRNTHQAVGQALSYVNSGKQHIVDIDLKNFFDEVDHVLLLQRLHRKIKCKETMRLIRRWLRVPIEIKGRLIKRRKGLPQGSPLSPLLSNIVLHDLDKELERSGLQFVRYADDFSIYCKSEAQARKAGNTVFLFLRDNLKLPINRDKSGIRRPFNFKILGYGFVPVYQKGVKGRYQLVASKKSWQSLKTKLREATRKTIPMSFCERIQKINEIQRGWINYFKHANIKNKLGDLDGWLRNRLRYCIWHHWKKREKRRRSLMRLGVEYGKAYAWSRSRKGGWATAQSPILGTTVTLDRLKMRGYLPMEELYNTVSSNYSNSLFPLI